MTAPGKTHEPFTFTAFGDEGIPGPSLDQDRSLLPESDWEEWNNGSYDPDNPSRTGVSTTNAVILEITRVRNLANHTPSRFNLLAGGLCYAQGDIQPSRPRATPPSRPPTAAAGTTTTRGSGRAGSR